MAISAVVQIIAVHYVTGASFWSTLIFNLSSWLLTASGFMDSFQLYYVIKKAKVDITLKRTNAKFIKVFLYSLVCEAKKEDENNAEVVV